MILVVESGSTKADWMLIDGNREMAYNTIGFNPYFHTKEDILIALNEHLELDLIKEKVKEIFFYGAGCSSDELNAIVHAGLQKFFANAKITVDHDLAACAHACYNNRLQIACILGTGSNSCYHDGKTVSEEVPALGYILGDEASGSYFGKQLLADYFYKRLPAPIENELRNLGITKASVVDRVYQQPHANVYIASMAEVLIRNKNLEYSQRIIREGIQKFIDIHVKCYSNYQNCEVNFVGSIASLLEDELRDVCNSNDLRVGSIIRRPLDRLVQYHKNRMNLAQANLAHKKSSQLN